MTKKSILLYVLGGFLLFFIVMPYAFYYFYLSWKLPGVIGLTIFFPLGIVAYPFIVAIKGLGGWLSVVVQFLIVIVVFGFIASARILSDKERVAFPIKTEVHLKEKLKVVCLNIKRFCEWLFLSWIEILGVAILLPFSVIFILLGPLRQQLFVASLKSKIWRKDYKTFFTLLIFFFYLQVVITVPGSAYQYFGKDRIIDGVVVAVALLAFIAFQFQRMTPPYFEATFLPSEGKSYQDKPQFLVKARVSQRILVFVHITNLGLTAFKNCVVSIVFPEGFTIVGDLRLYKGVDFAKKFVIQKKNQCIQFLPNDNYMTFPPCNNLIFPIWIKTPKEAGKYKVKTTLSSESTWGEAERNFLQIDIVDD